LASLAAADIVAVVVDTEPEAVEAEVTVADVGPASPRDIQAGR
jgi:hypothetical protein